MLTLGHGRLDRIGLTDLLTNVGVDEVVDVRRFPGSRANPAAARGALPDLLAELGIAYRWDERLGGRRSLTAAEDEASPDTWWRVPAFRAYAAWTRTPDFRSAAIELWQRSTSVKTAVMCSETVWWRCHRRLIADVSVLEGGVPVEHLMHDGALVTHRPSDGARLDTEGHLVWDGGWVDPSDRAPS